jgi:hypothetical protein
MTIDEVIQKREISELLHFTTLKGLLGVLGSKKILSREFLKQEDLLEHIANFNTPKVMDKGWEGYVNISISEINRRLFDISINKWDMGKNKWVILGITPEIMKHEGVIFATTNNGYTGVSRDQGADGLEALFAPKVRIYNTGQSEHRGERHSSHNPTCPQAEVLYPKELQTCHLTHIYVMEDEDREDINGYFEFTSHPKIDLMTDPKKFEGF